MRSYGYADAQGYTRTEVAPNTTPSPVAQLETVKAGARERLRGLPACHGLPIRKALCFAYEVSALQKDFANTGCLYSKSPDRKTSAAFEVSAAASEPFL